MNFKLLPLIMVGFLAFKPIHIKESNGVKDGNGDDKKKVVTKKNEKELAAVKTTKGSFKLDAMNKVILSNYLDLEQKNFEKPELQSFITAFKGYHKLKAEGKIIKDVLTIIDFTQSSTDKRMWVIDMVKNEIIFQTVVSHGRNSGKEYANDFSNKPESFKSSLGFYKTAETYMGKHGISLRLDGLEKGINDNARKRDIVIHGADYASESLGDKQGYLGRSLGCPALPLGIHKKIIDFIKDESCLFIYHGDNAEYARKSALID